jgi:YHS domain-containing protein
VAKIYHNIEESTFSFDTGSMTFFFSSELYLNKFKERYQTNREELKFKLSSRYNIDFEAIDYFDIILYDKIEKRGFKIVSLEGVNYTCLSNIKLDGVIRMLKN